MAGISSALDASVEVLEEETGSQSGDGTADCTFVLNDESDVSAVVRNRTTSDDDDSFFNNLPMDLSEQWAQAAGGTTEGRSNIDCRPPSATADAPPTTVTPIDKKLWRRGIYIAKRENVTPTPDYKSLTTPLIKAKLKQHGFRVCARRKAIRLLTRVFNVTHPYLNDRGEVSEVEESPETPRCRKEKKGRKRAFKCDGDRVNSFRKKAPSKTDERRPQESIESHADGDESESTEPRDSSVVEEESLLLLSDEELMEPAGSQAALGVEDQLRQFFRTRDDIYKKILQYEPLAFKSLHQSIRQAGIKCSSSKLLEFLDNQCITFTLKDEGRNGADADRIVARLSKKTKKQTRVRVK